MTRSEFWRSSMLVKQSSSFSRKHRTFISPDLCPPNSPIDYRICELMQNVCTLYKHVSAIPAAVTNDLKQRLIDTWASISQNVIDKAVGQWRKRLHANMRQNYITWTSTKLKPTFFRAYTPHNRLFSEPPAVNLENTLFRIISIAAI